MNRKSTDFWNNYSPQILNKMYFFDKARAKTSATILLILALIYIVLGICFFRKCSLLIKLFQYEFIGVPFICGGIYALCSSVIIVLTNKILNINHAHIIINIAILFLIPYYIAENCINKFIQHSHQEHVMLSMLYFGIDFLICILVLLAIINKQSNCNNDLVCFFIVLIFMLSFWNLGKITAWLLTKLDVKFRVKYDIKNNSISKEDVIIYKRKLFMLQWNIIKTELQYSMLYWYIIISILVLMMPKMDGSILQRLSNQFMGITAIAALCREAKAKIDK